MIDLLGELLCFLGLHKWNYKYMFLPSIEAGIVTDFIADAKCFRCDKTRHLKHLIWDGRNMVEKNNKQA